MSNPYFFLVSNRPFSLISNRPGAVGQAAASAFLLRERFAFSARRSATHWRTELNCTSGAADVGLPPPRRHHRRARKGGRRESKQQPLLFPVWCSFASPSVFGMNFAIRKVSSGGASPKGETPGLTGRATSLSVFGSDGLGISCRFSFQYTSACLPATAVPVGRVLCAPAVR